MMIIGSNKKGIMKAKKLAEILMKTPDAIVTLSVSDADLHVFCNEIFEVTTQGENQITIVANITEKNETNN